jgi:hypothetical protein
MKSQKARAKKIQPKKSKAEIASVVQKVIELVLPLFVQKGLEKILLSVRVIFDLIKRWFLK